MKTHTLVGGGGQREPDDFYRTPEWATKALLDLESFHGTTWEPACGNGAISKLFPTIMSSDLFERGYGESGVNFLITYRLVNNIVTNPPYKLAQEFVEHALICATRKVAMLLKLNFLEGIKRNAFFKNTPLKTVYVFSRRLDFGKGLEDGKGRGLLACAWFIWEKGYEGEPKIRWIL